MTLPTLLKRLGFGKNAHAVYAALLANKKPLLVAHIAGAIGTDRPEVYRNLRQLLAHGFVKKTVVGKRTYYTEESPRRIHDAFAAAETTSARVAETMARTRGKELPEHVRYFKGFNGVRAVFDDVIEKTPRGGTFYRYTSERDLEVVNQYLSPAYRARRDKKKLERLVISNPVSGTQKRSRLERFIKFFPQQTFEQNIIQLVYADYVAFINLTTEEAYIIHDRALADFQAVIFKQLYRRL